MQRRNWSNVHRYQHRMTENEIIGLEKILYLDWQRNIAQV